jgi:hypothetical protein
MNDSLSFLVGAISLSLLEDTAFSQTAAGSVGFDQRVQVTAVRNKKTRIDGGDFDDKMDRISFTIKLTNSDTKLAFDNYQGEFYVFAQSILNSKAFQLLGVEKFAFSIPPRGVHTQLTPEVITRWDKTDFRFGAKYDSGVFVARDAEGKVVSKKSSSGTWLPLVDRMGDLTPQRYYDRQLNPVMVEFGR